MNIINDMLTKNPFLLVKIQKSYLRNRLLEIFLKIGIFFCYFLLKPVIINQEKRKFNTFLEYHNIISFSKDKTIFYLPNLKWENNNVVGEYVQKSIYYHKNYYECDILDIVSELIPKHGIILDIGANIGNHSLYFAQKCLADKIYAFEPVEKTFDILEENIRLNKLENIVFLKNYAVGSTSCKAKINFFDEKNFGSTRIAKDQDGKLVMVAIDDIEINERVDFVKIDIEGFELEALIGMKKTILMDKPCILIEIWKENFERVNSLFTQYQYKMIWSCGDNYFYKAKENI